MSSSELKLEIDSDQSKLTREHEQDGLCRILCLDGGGAKGFYTLGVLKEIESMLGCPLYKRFDLIFGTSTGSIIAALLALGYEIDAIHEIYKKHVPSVMSKYTARGKSEALEKLAQEIFSNKTFEDFKTNVGIVSTKWVIEQPMVFKSDIAQAHGRTATFVPGFGVSISDAVQASCSAYPIFKRKIVTTASGDQVELFDGGYCANNPTLYAIADAVGPMNRKLSDLKVINVGVGIYPEPKGHLLKRILRKFFLVRLLQKTLEINTQSMDQLRKILFHNVDTIRISDTFAEPEMATSLTEHNLSKLNILRQRGRDSFASRETELIKVLL